MTYSCLTSFSRFLVAVLFVFALFLGPQQLSAQTCDSDCEAQYQTYLQMHEQAVTTKGWKGPRLTPSQWASQTPQWRSARVDELNRVMNGTNTDVDKGKLAQQGKQAAARQRVSTCSGGWGDFFNPACWLRLISALVASAFLSLGVLILTIAGLLFNIAIEYGIDKFSTLYGWVQSGVELGWTVFRDLANIIIIGLFTFVAISTILGSSEYGYRKMVPRVLLVAILINFSLLFTKLIIDTSHFVASKFIDSMVAAQQAAGTSSVVVPSGDDVAGDKNAGGAVATQAQTAGIAGAFMNKLGIPGLGNTFASVRKAQEEHNSWLVGLGYGILALIVSLAAAAVFLYGAYLLIARSILLLILLLTSSLAFATYLIPKLDSGSYGWKKWWDSLFKSAIFAPMLIILLWISLKIAEPLAKGIGGKGTLGAIAADPAANIGALFNYLIVLGFLFASIKIASAVSSNLPFTDIARRATAGLTAGIPLMMSGRLAGMLGRNTFGRGGRALEGSMMKSAAGLRANGNTWRANLMELGARTAGSLKTRDFNALQTGLGNRLAKEMGLKQATLAGGKLGGIAGIQKKKTEVAAEQGEALAKASEKLSKTEKDAVIAREREKEGTELSIKTQQKKAAEEQLEELKKTREAIQTERGNTAATLQERKKAIEENKAKQAEVAAEQQSEQSTMVQHETAIRAKDAQIQAVKTAVIQATNDTQKAQLQTQLDQLTDELGSLNNKRDASTQAIAAHDKTLKQLRGDESQLRTALETATTTHTDADNKLKNAESVIASTEKRLETIEKATKVAENDLFSSGRYAESVARSMPYTLGRDRNAIAADVRKKIKDKGKNKKLKDALKQLQDEAGVAPKAEEKK